MTQQTLHSHLGYAESQELSIIAIALQPKFLGCAVDNKARFVAKEIS